MRDDFEDPDFIEKCMIGGICSIVVSVLIVGLVHWAESRSIQSSATPAILEASDHGR
jgi:hypothetical protein